MLRMLKNAVFALIVLSVAGLAYLFFAPQPVAVDLAAVDRGRLEVTVDEEGYERIRTYGLDGLPRQTIDIEHYE